MVIGVDMFRVKYIGPSLTSSGQFGCFEENFNNIHLHVPVLVWICCFCNTKP